MPEKMPEEWKQILTERVKRLLGMLEESTPESLIAQEIILVLRAGFGYSQMTKEAFVEAMIQSLDRHSREDTE